MIWRDKFKIFLFRYLLVFIFIGTPFLLSATHIVGGSLTYVHNGGSSYTVTLRLYRDCGPGTAGFPGSVNISVRGNDGATFNPSRDFNMPRGAITLVPSSLDPCADPPNPLPCVEEAIYTATVTNLPQNLGGYHLFYQIIARNLSIVNINAACNCIGESFYAFIPGSLAIWNEDFVLPDNTTVDNGATAWSVANGVPAPNSAMIDNDRFEFRGANNAVSTWSSQVLNIAGNPAGVDLIVDLSENGNFEGGDNISVFYRLNGGGQVPFTTNGSINNDFGTATATELGVIGTTVQIEVMVTYSGNSPNNERYRIENVAVSEGGTPNLSNPEFNLLPPLFLCAGQPFTFDHSATDLDGDSLVYSFYDPYNGDNGNGPLDPTYVNNIAVFTPIVWLPGFSTNDPLGGMSLSIDPVTGLLSGTPPNIGQYVLGVKVEEYRNGVYLSETLRDFQVNVVSCPPPNLPLAGADVLLNDGCLDTLNASGFVESTVTWTSIFPDAPGTHDGFLSCTTGCLDPIATGTNSAPVFVDYIVCGIAAACDSAFVCDTVRVTFNPSLSVSITPVDPVICFGQTSTTLTAVGSGGSPPYTYLWNNINPSPTNVVGAGNFTVMLADGSGCPPVSSTVTVTAFNNPITANAGVDDTVCIQNPIVTLNGSVTGATGGFWAGGNGTFSPDSAALIGANYIPTAAELANGFVDITLTTTGNGICPLAMDTVRISFLDFIGNVVVTPTNVSCFGDVDGSAVINITGGIAPFTYFWNTTPAQTTATAINLSPGMHTVMIQNGIGCMTMDSVEIEEPNPLAINTTVIDVSCFGGSDGSIAASTVGGTGPYTYLWSPGGEVTDTINGQLAGNYSVTVTDSNGCTLTVNDTILDPVPLNVMFTPTNVTCQGGNNGEAAAVVTGGQGPYNYSWSPFGGSGANAVGLTAGTYVLTITDFNNCTFIDSVVISEPLTPVMGATTVSNISCVGFNDGSIFVTPSGGTGPYTFLWSPGGEVTDTINGQLAGNYSVTVTDSNGCTSVATATITEPNPLVTNTNQTNVTCFGGNDGVASINTSGGLAPYTYLWTPGNFTTTTINNLAQGNYTVVVTDTNGCQQTETLTITQPALPVSIALSSTPVSCNGDTDGSVTALGSGGTGPYSYLWLPGGQTTPTVNGLLAGTYTVNVTDSNGCLEIDSVVVTEPIALSVLFSQTDVSCFGGNDGIATANAANGTGPYSYLWMPGGQVTNSITGLSAGTYVVTITDFNSCTLIDSVIITEPLVAVSGNTSTTNSSCFGFNDGTATATGLGGTQGYTYLWDAAAANQVGAVATGLTAGTYTVLITDLNSCTFTDTAVVGEPNSLTIAFASQVNASCFGGNDGAVTAVPAGGTPNYTYSWLPGAETTSSLSNLAAGNYSVTVTDDNGCQEMNSVTIIQPVLPVNIAVSSTPTSCNAGNDGTVTALGSGGTSPYTYMWLPVGQTGATLTGLTAGNYTVTATDSNGCIAIDSIMVTEPVALSVALSQTDVSCLGGSNGVATANGAGGTGPYSYLWMPGGFTTNSITGLSSGTYTVNITDFNGCTITDSVVIVEPLLAVSGNTSTTSTSCTGFNDGTATAVGLGGTSGYTYLWDGSTGNQVTATAVGLFAGTYMVTITDANGCSTVETAIVNEPTPISITFGGQSNVSCFGGNNGAITAGPSGGTPNYSYLWTPGGFTSNSLTGLAGGTYSLTVTDNNGCTGMNSISITQPLAPVSINMSSTTTSCSGGNDGTATAVGAGGTGPYTYSWLPGGQTGSTISGLTAGTYTVTATDANGCQEMNTVVVAEPAPIVLLAGAVNSTCGVANGLADVTIVSGGTGPFNYLWTPTGATTASISGLFSGVYTVVVTDANGCTATATGNVNDNASPALTVISVTNVSCNGGSDGTATVTTTGGIGPFNYLWSPSGETTPVAVNLNAGVHSVVVTGSNGCQSSIAVSPQITEPDPIVTVVTTTPVNCNGGTDGMASAISIGGTAGYTYQWLPGGATGNLVTGLMAGVDSVQTTDANGCIDTTLFTITEPIAPISVGFATTQVSCNAGNDGQASAIASGGTGPYSYNWMPGNISGQTISNLTAGTYIVTITDLNGCTLIDSIPVTEPTAISLPIASVGSTCGLPNGQTSVTPTGGTGPYTYSWFPSGATTPVVTGLLSGMYTVTVTDANSCVQTASITVNNTSGPTVSVTGTTPVSCNGGMDGTATVSVVGGTAPFTYLWSPIGGTGPTATGLPTGVYTVVVTDGNNCPSNIAVSPLVAEPDPIVTVVTTTPVNCNGGADGMASAISVGGTPGYTYEWLPGASAGPSVIGLSVGVDSVRTTDVNGCIQTTLFTITEPLTPLSANLSATPVSCNTGNDGQASAIASGGTGPYSYNWMPGSISGQTISNLTAGTYIVTVTDLNGCILIDSIAVIEPTPINLPITSVNSTCGLPNGQTSVAPTGGTGPYAYNWFPSGATTPLVTGLLSGMHTVTVTDMNGCMETASVLVNNTAGPIATVTGTTPTTCNGGMDGSATVSVVGGTGPFSYLWSPIGGTGPTATGLPTGVYTVVVTDGNNCVSNIAVSPLVAEPNPIITQVTTNEVNCNGGSDGSASAISVGGTPGYNYLWLPGGSTGISVTGLSAGMDSVRTTDANGCVQTTSFTITEPTALTASVSSVTDVSCLGGGNGSATVVASGGTPFYSYSWSPMGGNGATATGLAAGNYVVTVTDLNSCPFIVNVTISEPAQSLSATSTTTDVSCFGGSDGTGTVTPVGGTAPYSYFWSPFGGTNQTEVGLSAGNYIALVTDTNGCQTNIVVIIDQRPLLVGALDSINPSCGFANGSVLATVSGGTAPYNYLWTPGAAVTQTITNLNPGTYSVGITDSLGCPLTLSANIVDIPGPTITIPTSIDVSCFGGNDGSATVNIVGGTAPYNTVWAPFGGNNIMGAALTEGTFIATVTDDLGCVAIDSVAIAEPSQVVISIDSVTSVSCFGFNDGDINISASGGTGAYTYTWLPNVSTDSSASNLSAGVYSITVTDANGCSVTTSVNLTEPAAPLAASMGTIMDPSCFTSTNGTAMINVSGGTAPFTYLWSNTQTSNTATNLIGGVYTVIVTDDNGCITNDTIVITQPSPVVTIPGPDVTICLGSSEDITATATGGNGPYSFSWQPVGINNPGTLNVAPVVNTTYTVSAFDQNGCPGDLQSISAVVLEFGPANVSTSVTAALICPGQSTDVAVQTTGIQMEDSLTYVWNNGLPSGPGPFTVSPTQSTTYIVTVTNSCGVAVIDSIQVNLSPLPVLLISADADSVCFPTSIQFTDSSTTGNPLDQIHTWDWSFGDGSTSQLQNPLHTYDQAGTYQVMLTITTGNGCATTNATTPLIITVFPKPTASFSLNMNTFSLPIEELITTNTSSGASLYNWSFGDGETSTNFEPTYLYTTIGDFRVNLIATNEFGCSDTTFDDISASADLIIPNAFTPSLNGPSGGFYDPNSLDNNIFFPFTSGVVEFEFQIFDRWGELIFHTNDHRQGWDGYYKGQLVQKGVYIWKIRASLNNGKLFNKTGDVTLLR